MQVLIHKTGLVRLSANRRMARIGLGDPVQLQQEGATDIAAFVMLPSRMPFGLGKSRITRAGYLGNQARALLWPAFEKDAALRVRIVEILAAHLASDGLNRISISVWGDPADIVPSGPITPIFSRSRIHDDPVDDEWRSSRSNLLNMQSPSCAQSVKMR